RKRCVNGEKNWVYCRGISCRRLIARRIDMKMRVSRGVLLAASVIALVTLLVGGAATAATPTEGTIGPASGSSTAWDFGPVGPGVSSGGTVEFLCAPVYCDSYQLTVSLPAQDQEFYLTHKATLHIDYTWTSTGPDD